MRIPERLQRRQPWVQAEEAIEVDGAFGIVRRRNRDAWARRVVVAFAERHDHVQTVHRAALEDRNQDLPPSSASGFDRAREKRGRKSQTEKRQPPVLHEDASRDHGYLLWNSGEPSVS